MFQVWLSMDQPDFEGVPLIVDEMMPPQLIELLRLFVGEDHPLIVLRPGERIRVRELSTCSKVVYWPGGEQRPDPELDFELSDSEALARVVARLQPLLETLPTDGLPERIYLTRKSGQGRQLENRGAVEAFFRDRGFAVLDFNALPVREQLCHLRAARTVVMEAGSSIYGLLFCRPGTRIGELAGPPMEEYLWVADMCRSLGHRLLLFPFDGAFDPPASSPPAQLRADLASLPGFLEQLESGEAPPARLQASPAGS